MRGARYFDQLGQVLLGLSGLHHHADALTGKYLGEVGRRLHHQGVLPGVRPQSQDFGMVGLPQDDDQIALTGEVWRPCPGQT